MIYLNWVNEMKNKIRLISVLLVVCLVITGCNGTVTRDIRKDGYAVSDGKFVCGFFDNTSEDKAVHEKIRYLLGDYIISERGNIYEISLGGLYSNNMNCRKGKTLGTKVSAVLDQSVIRGADGYYYYLASENSASSYTRISNSDENYEIYNLLLGDRSVLKAITVNSSINSYYVLKTNGEIYNYIIEKKKDSEKYELRSYNVINKGEYGKIIDFYYAGESLSTFYRTNDSIYTYKVKNAEKCNTYVDIPCQYDLDKDVVLNQYKDRIIGFNGVTLITDYGRVFNAGS